MSLPIGERSRETPRTGKKMLGGAGRPLSPSRLHRGKGRDTLLEEELTQIREGLHGRDQYICVDTLREAKKPEGRARRMNRPLDSHIFGEAIHEKPVTQRIRPVLSDAELVALHGESDARKADAAQHFAQEPDILGKMLSDNYPMKHPGDQPKRRKKSFQRVTHEIPETEVEPAGFRGLGVKCQPNHHRGIAMKKDYSSEVNIAEIDPHPTRLPRRRDITGPIN